MVEDQPLLASDLADALRAAGAEEVLTSTRADHALQMINERVPDVLILDLSLDDSEEGFGIAEIALQLFNPPPRLIFTTGSPERIPERLVKAGKVYPKPYDADALARDATGQA